MNPIKNILIVDDEADLRDLLLMSLNSKAIKCSGASGVKEAKQQLENQAFDLCLTDLNMPDGSGLELVSLVQERYPNTPIAMISAYGSMDLAIEALKAGAFDFISKPIDLNQLRTLVNRALSIKPIATNACDVDFIGESPAIKNLKEQVLPRIARGQAPVYISGESGTGKELVARMIHQLGPRSEGPFVPVNAGAIPTELMESEFFGYMKGSFTGAQGDKKGLFEQAHGGTLFLDEVADLSLPMQVKLLRAIQEKKVRPIGSNKEITVDIRMLSATHKSLQNLVDAGKFRQDLYYRINVIQVTLPPLRDRQEDVPAIAKFFLSKLSDPTQTPLSFSDEAIQALSNYHFPGNIRELENILERAITLTDQTMLMPEHLGLPNSQLKPSSTTDHSNQQAAYNQTSSGKPEHDPAASPCFDPTVDTLEQYLNSIEGKIIATTLEQCNGNKTMAAQTLSMSLRSLRYRIQKLGL